MPESAKETFHQPPFPPLQWDGYSWVGQMTLESWRGFQSRQGPYDSVSSLEESDGSTQLNLEMRDEKQPSASPEQAVAFQYLLDNQEEIRDAILQAIFDTYPKWQQELGYDEDEAAQFMPDLANATHLKSLMGLSWLHILKVHKEGAAYVGFEFGCTWEDEHGLGVLTHKNRIVDLGYADTAFIGWNAERDAGWVEES